MALEEIYISLMVASLRYTCDNNIAEDGTNKLAAKVVKLEDIESFLRQNMLQEFKEMLVKYSSLEQFLSTEHDYNFFEKDSGIDWKYEIISVSKYNQVERCKKKTFPSLKFYVSYKENLFVIHVNKRSYFDITEKLTTQIYESLEGHLIPESQYSVHRDIRNRVNAMVQEVFSEIWATAELIGSSKKGLATSKTRVVMVIHIPPSSFEVGSEHFDSKNWETSPYNLKYLSRHLENIGMINIETFPKSNRCMFHDPATGMDCRLSPDLGLVYERDEMILEYFKLDTRVKPLVAAVNHFTRNLWLQKTYHFQLMGSTSYIIMVLRFLMNGLEKPVIVSLQYPPVTCKSTRCRYNRDNGRLVTKFSGKICEFYVKYHDCICIKNRVAGEYNGSGNFAEESESTIWTSNNSENLGSLLIGFFRFYSKGGNYRPISIINNDGTPFDMAKEDCQNTAVFVQDPYIIQKNLASTCSGKYYRKIVESFRAAEMALKNGASFDEVCERQIEQDDVCPPMSQLSV